MHENFTLCITTKDRLEDLQQTLGRLLEFGLFDAKIIIYDDGSKEPIEKLSTLEKFTSLRIIRNSESKGLIYNRNRMAELAETEFIISLDDDSCFTEKPDFSYLEDVFRRWPRAAALQLNDFEINFGERPLKDETPEQPVQMFTGFGHVLRRKLFLGLGGYLEDLIHMAEERDFCLRAWSAQYVIIFAPKVAVEHRRSPVARSLNRNIYFLTRNTIIFSFRNIPIHLAIAKFIFIVPYFSLKNMTLAPVVKGFCSGAKWVILNLNSKNQRIPNPEYRKYCKLPQRRPAEISGEDD